MFGLTRLSPEEKAEHKRKKRIEKLESDLKAETLKRSESLKKSEGLRKELESLEK